MTQVAVCVMKKGMRRSFAILSLGGLAAAASGCSQGDAIDESGAVYDGIAPDAAITLTGTEPFWGIEIEPEQAGAHAARFTIPEEIDGSVFSLTRFAGNNGLGFSGELEGRSVQIAITPGDCSGGMSNRSYPFVATVALDETTLMGCGFTDAAPFTGPEAS